MSARGGKGGIGEGGVNGRNSRHYFEQPGWSELHGVRVYDCPADKDACLKLINREIVTDWGPNNFSGDKTTLIATLGGRGLEPGAHGGGGGYSGLGGPGGKVSLYQLEVSNC